MKRVLMIYLLFFSCNTMFGFDLFGILRPKNEVKAEQKLLEDALTKSFGWDSGERNGIREICKENYITNYKDRHHSQICYVKDLSTGFCVIERWLSGRTWGVPDEECRFYSAALKNINTKRVGNFRLYWCKNERYEKCKNDSKLSDNIVEHFASDRYDSIDECLKDNIQLIEKIASKSTFVACSQNSLEFVFRVNGKVKYECQEKSQKLCERGNIVLDSYR